jgi:hypothetical protein
VAKVVIQQRPVEKKSLFQCERKDKGMAAGMIEVAIALEEGM